MSGLFMAPRHLAAGAALLLAQWFAAPLAIGQLLVISGLGGESKFSETFHAWALELLDSAEQRLGLAADAITYLAEDPTRDPQRIDGRATREAIERALATLVTDANAAPDASQPVLIVLIGHGSVRDGVAYFNIPGPDISAADFAAALAPLQAQTPLVFINTSASSGPFIAALSGPGRVVITATESGRERYFARFARFFIDALNAPDSDVDKDQRVSVLEAFEFARRQVARDYSEDGRLQTEHPLLDDNGDGEGSLQPDPQSADNPDGALARTVYLATAAELSTTAAADDPERLALLEAKRDIERRIEALRQRKDTLGVDDYEMRLEDLLVELALNGRELRALAESESEPAPEPNPEPELR